MVTTPTPSGKSVLGSTPAASGTVKGLPVTLGMVTVSVPEGGAAGITAPTPDPVSIKSLALLSSQMFRMVAWPPAKVKLELLARLEAPI